MKKNIEIRELAKVNNVYLWELGEQLGYSDVAFSRKLRKEFSAAEKLEAIQAIKNLTEQREV